jgi:phenylalanyl-tRNA synthetase beta chain
VGIEAEAAPAGIRITVSVEPIPLKVAADTADVLVAVVPTWRRDMAIEADVAEEVARVRGYETTPAHLPDTLMPAYRPSPLKVRDLIRETMAGAGLTEVVTHALVAPAREERLGWPADSSDPALPPDLAAPSGQPIAVTNPLSAQHTVLRLNLGTSLLDVLSLNERQGRPDVAVFEVGNGYVRTPEGPRQWTRLGFLLSGAAEAPAWNRAAREFDLDDAKGIVELLSHRLGLTELSYAPDRRGYPFHPGRALLVTAPNGEEKISGRVAELHPDALARWDLRSERVMVAELAIRGLGAGVPARPHVEPIPRFPEVERDLAVVVAESHSADEVEATIRRHGGDLLRGLRLFDLYHGAPLAAEEKSLAYRLVLGAGDRTLTEAEVEEAVAGVRAGLASDLGARLRT